MTTATETLGSIAMLMLRSEHFSSMTLKQIGTLCMPPLDAGYAAVASTPMGSDAGANEGVQAPLAFALFAKVDDEWHSKLQDADFSLQDMPKDAWTSGDHAWLVEMLCPPDAAEGFALKAAASVFQKGEDLNMRLRDAGGTVKVIDRKI